METSSTRPFAFSTSLINRITVGLSAYILLCLYPAYGLLRGWWMGDYSSFASEGLLTAVATASAFGVFARLSMPKYLTVDDTISSATDA